MSLLLFVCPGALRDAHSLTPEIIVFLLVISLVAILKNLQAAEFR